MNTIRFIIISLTATVAAVSCTKNEMEGCGYGDGRIGFIGNPGDAFTRGMPVESVADIPNMGVFAYYTGNGTSNNWAANGATATPDFMNNVKVSHNSGSWTYDNPAYWPQAADANISFFAYSPHAAAANGITPNVTTGIPTISYTVPTNCSDQPDLMVAALVADRNKTNNGSAPVNFQMRHALTCIGFKASGNGQQITKLEIQGVKTNGILTTNADGTFSWNIASSSTGNFEATVDTDVYLDPSSQLVNTGGGYLMMIPQTLPAGARLIVGVDDGRPDVEFDLSGITWSSGQRINYSLSVSPDAIIMLTPERIVLPPMGGFSQFNVIVQNESPKAWTIAGTNFYICDNLADLQGWAAGTLTAANVKNLDGTIPVIGSYSGSGTTTLYAWKPTSNNSTTNEITGTIVNTDDTDIKINLVQLPDYASSVIHASYIHDQYVGAYWKNNQKGERIIRIPVSSSLLAGSWDASVFWLGDGWSPGDIVFSTEDSDDAGITYNRSTETPVDMLLPANDATFSVSGHLSSASGSVVSGAGNYISFRIGLTSTYTPTTSVPVRYALVLLRYGSPQKYHVIFIRQGEEADYLMYPGDGGRGLSAVRFSAYNATASDMANSSIYTDILGNLSNAAFTDYPSQAGALFQWAPLSYPRRTYNADITTVPTGWLSQANPNFWESIKNTYETCPPGYRRPNDGLTSAVALNNSASNISNSEIRQSLYADPPIGGNQSNGNMRWGFYADGFFDRRAHNNPYVGPGVNGYDVREGNTAVAWGTKDIAYIGTLFFNPSTNSPRRNASIFVPGAGYKYSFDGELIEAGQCAALLTASAPDTENMWYLIGTANAQQLESSKASAMSLRCVKAE